jgi:hypothetical protein
MTRAEIVSLFDRRQEAVGRRDVRALVETHSVDCEMESQMAGTVRGRAAIEQVYNAWFKGFQDLTSTQEELLVDGDQVAQITNLEGTDNGGFMGVPPTGKRFRLTMIFLCTVKDGEITRARTIYDSTGLLVQIGVLKAKPI